MYWLTVLEGDGRSWHEWHRDAAEMTACREGRHGDVIRRLAGTVTLLPGSSDGRGSEVGL